MSIIFLLSKSMLFNNEVHNTFLKLIYVFIRTLITITTFYSIISCIILYSDFPKFLVNTLLKSYKYYFKNLNPYHIALKAQK